MPGDAAKCPAYDSPIDAITAAQQVTQSPTRHLTMRYVSVPLSAQCCTDLCTYGYAPLWASAPTLYLAHHAAH